VIGDGKLAQMIARVLHARRLAGEFASNHDRQAREQTAPRAPCGDRYF
jgi:hypothetical protein